MVMRTKSRTGLETVEMWTGMDVSGGGCRAHCQIIGSGGWAVPTEDGCGDSLWETEWQ